MKTNKMNKVLIALDFDPTAQKIAEVGFTLAQTLGAEVILLHVIVDLVTYSLTYLNMGPLQLDSVDELKQASQNFLEKVKRHLGDDTILTVIKEGEFAEIILETATELDADIIVMGSHSTKWLENIVMGSVTADVLKKTTIPMFIIPTKKRN
ncbi:MAG TPA: universal stress protein [Paludibacter sp.]